MASPPPTLAFFYGAQPPWEQLQAFDLVVVDPDHVPDPAAPGLARTRLAAYVALGEVQTSRPYAKAIPSAWLKGDNKDWGSRVLDQSHPDWPRFFTEQVIGPLWKRGYRSFFLDTLDSYQLFAKSPQERALQESGMVAVIEAITRRYPDIRLVFNRGFEILPRVHQHVEMVVAESLFRGYDAGKKKYVNVPEADRRWLLGELQRARDEFKLQVGAIDYVPPADRDGARETARKIRELGMIPWVSSPDLASMGVGTIEVMPRKVLVIHNVLASEYALAGQEAVRLGSLPLNYLGYAPEFVDTDSLPEGHLPGRYAGVVVWLNDPPGNAGHRRLTRWLAAQVHAKLPIAMINPGDYMWSGPLAKELGMKSAAFVAAARAADIVQQRPEVGFETPPRPAADNFLPLNAQGAQPWLTLRRDQQEQVAVALTPWGGYALENFAVITLPGNHGDRWVINPFAFFQQALRLPAMPVPDVSTESGRRMLMTHMDGDGFVSRSELPGNPITGEVVLHRVVKKYPVPMTISVIEAELSPNGLYPGLSAWAERTAQEIFRHPHVAIASHSYSHPFIWSKVGAGGDEGRDSYNLRIPGYRFDARREIEGSIRYIENRLAPPGKKVEMFLWTGDCIPGSDALALTQEVGVMNMNGGDTVAMRTQATVTAVEGLGVPRKTAFQVYAPNQNENVYTNNWTGPFYGYERVIETFEFTESPRRLKPINIYFHTYLAAKAAGMRSLDKVFDYALAQETTPVFVADYARKVLDFQRLSVARSPTGWSIRGARDARTLRLPAGMGWPDMEASRGIAGYRQQGESIYIHLGADSAELVLESTPTQQVRLVSANARIESSASSRKGTWQWDLSGQVPLKFTLAHAKTCKVRVAGRELRPVRVTGDTSDYEIREHAAKPLETLCSP
nr:endo alpha-1,4 polygalactosaminidase [uncultured Rhodoferax sp.]